jgi:SH3-like domain-containing protein
MIRLVFMLILLLSPSAFAGLCVTSNGVNLRTGPGPKYPVSWKVSKYTPLAEIKTTGGWIEVEDMDGEHHWIYSGNVTRKLICVTVRTNTAKLRKTPGPQGELADIKQVDRYTSFKRIDEQDDWYQVEASWGETYWIHDSMVWRPLKISKLNF